MVESSQNLLLLFSIVHFPFPDKTNYLLGHEQYWGMVIDKLNKKKNFSSTYLLCPT